MLGSSVVNSFLLALQKQYKFELITDFFLLPDSCINKKSLDEIKEIIQGKLKTKDLPIVVPIVFDRDSWIVRNHIATIMITENEIEYFDPKGVLSSYQGLQSENSLRDVLEHINEELFEGNGTIKENTITHQFDINNCGVFACYYIYQKLKGKPLQNPIALTEISDFRNKMLKICFPE